MPARSRRSAASGCLKGVMQSVPASVVQSRGQRGKQHFCPHRFPRPLPDFLETAGPRSTVPKWASHTMDEGFLVVGGRGSQNLSHWGHRLLAGWVLFYSHFTAELSEAQKVKHVCSGGGWLAGVEAEPRLKTRCLGTGLHSS